MLNRDFLLYAEHAGVWLSFGVAGRFVKDRESSSAAAQTSTPTPAREATAPYSRAVLAIHFLAFGIMYFGLGNTIVRNRVPFWFHGQRIAGGVIIAVGAALMCWARVWFASWRYRAKVDTSHQLATGGPFAFLRHPIYMGLNLLALGSAVWDPTLPVWIGAALMVLGSDLRGRAEERLLSAVFGQAYSEYLGRTKRFLPGIY